MRLSLTLALFFVLHLDPIYLNLTYYILSYLTTCSYSTQPSSGPSFMAYPGLFSHSFALTKYEYVKLVYAPTLAQNPAHVLASPLALALFLF